MSPPLGAASVGSGHPPFSKTRSISVNYAPFSTKFSGICILTRWSWIREKDAEKCHPPGAPHPVSWNTANYLSLAITNECRWNFQELVYWLGEEKWVKKYWNMLPPPGAAPTPPIIKCTISLPITNRFIQNFQELFHWLDKKEYSKKYWNITPLGAAPPPYSQILNISGNYETIDKI